MLMSHSLWLLYFSIWLDVNTLVYSRLLDMLYINKVWMRPKTEKDLECGSVWSSSEVYQHGCRYASHARSWSDGIFVILKTKTLYFHALAILEVLDCYLALTSKRKLYLLSTICWFILYFLKLFNRAFVHRLILHKNNFPKCIVLVAINSILWFIEW